MRLRVLLFGPVAEIYGAREEWLELGEAPTVADVYYHYRQRDPRVGQLGRSLHIAVNRNVVTPDHCLAAEDEIALLPPVCGGSGANPAIPIDRIDLIETPLEDHPWRRHFDENAGSYGAVNSFEGLVRGDSIASHALRDSSIEQLPVTALRFDAYRPMAIAALHRLAEEARQRWPIQSIVMLHRLGLVPAGKICVIVAVATGHREEAFAVCKFLIDTLKTTVPIWKQEITATDSRWVEGTLLPLTGGNLSS